MAEKLNKSYVLPRDWLIAITLVTLFTPLLILFCKLCNLTVISISAAEKFTFQDIWGISIATIFFLFISFFLLKGVYRSIKKTTLQFTSEGFIVDDKKMIKWDDLIGYKRDDNSVTLIHYNDKPYRFYTGNLTYYVEEDLKKLIREIPEKSKK